MKQYYEYNCHLVVDGRDIWITCIEYNLRDAIKQTKQQIMNMGVKIYDIRFKGYKRK